MRLLLVHNPSAGVGDLTGDGLAEALDRAGHSVSLASIEDHGTLEDTQPATSSLDAIVVAGGDGSVRRVSTRVVGRRMPIAILPVGTANNIARSIGVPRDPFGVIRRLSTFVPMAYDVGRVEGPWGCTLFLEGTGFGPFVRTALLLSSPAQHEAFDHPQERLARDRLILEQMVRSYAVQDCEIELADETLRTSCLAVHIMNLPRVGPGLEMAPAADPADGCLDVVVVEEPARQRFADFVAAHRWGGDVPEAFPVRRAPFVRLHWQGAELHVDDDLHQTGTPSTIAVRVLPGALTFLRPEDAKD